MFLTELEVTDNKKTILSAEHIPGMYRAEQQNKIAFDKILAEFLETVNNFINVLDENGEPVMEHSSLKNNGVRRMVADSKRKNSETETGEEKDSILERAK